jgi:hypothetical protein
MGSSEFQNKWAGLTEEQFVKAAYAFVLERAPDQAGETYWLNQLKGGQVTEQQLLQSFIESIESNQITDALTQNGYLSMF